MNPCVSACQDTFCIFVHDFLEMFSVFKVTLFHIILLVSSTTILATFPVCMILYTSSKIFHIAQSLSRTNTSCIRFLWLVYSLTCHLHQCIFQKPVKIRISQDNIPGDDLFHFLAGLLVYYFLVKFIH